MEQDLGGCMDWCVHLWPSSDNTGLVFEGVVFYRQYVSSPLIVFMQWGPVM